MGRRTAHFRPVLIIDHVPHGFTQDPSTDAAAAAAAAASQKENNLESLSTCFLILASITFTDLTSDISTWVIIPLVFGFTFEWCRVFLDKLWDERDTGRMWHKARYKYMGKVGVLKAVVDKHTEDSRAHTLFQRDRKFSNQDVRAMLKACVTVICSEEERSISKINHYLNQNEEAGIVANVKRLVCSRCLKVERVAPDQGPLAGLEEEMQGGALDEAHAELQSEVSLRCDCCADVVARSYFTINSTVAWNILIRAAANACADTRHPRGDD